MAYLQTKSFYQYQLVTADTTEKINAKKLSLRLISTS